MNMKVVKFFAIGLGLLFVASISNAANLNVSGGTLLGASNVEVDGVLYNVLFLDGTAIDLYDGADESTDFTFFEEPNDTFLAQTAGQALLDQVFIDEFDSNPELINGCVTTGGCYVYIPAWVNAQGGIGGITVRNNATQEDVIGSLSRHNTFDTSPLEHAPGADDRVWAVWSETSEVPIPGAGWLLSFGLVTLIGLSRKKR